MPTKKTDQSTPIYIIRADNLNLSAKFLLAFGDFVAVQIPDAEKKWKFEMRRDLGIYLGDAHDTERGFPISNPSTGAVQILLD